MSKLLKKLILISAVLGLIPSLAFATDTAMSFNGNITGSACVSGATQSADSLSFVPGTGDATVEGWIYASSTIFEHVFVFLRAADSDMTFRWGPFWDLVGGSHDEILQSRTAGGLGELKFNGDIEVVKWNYFRMIDDRTNNQLTATLWSSTGTLILSSSAAGTAGARNASKGIRMGAGDPVGTICFNGCLRNIAVFNNVETSTTEGRMFQQNPATTTMAAFFPLANATDNSERVANHTSTLYNTPTACPTAPPFIVPPAAGGINRCILGRGLTRSCTR